MRYDIDYALLKEGSSHQALKALITDPSPNPHRGTAISPNLWSKLRVYIARLKKDFVL